MSYVNVVFVLFCVMAGLLPITAGFAGEGIHPPWEESPEGGIVFTVPGIDNIPDLYGDIVDPDLTIFLGGNEFMVMPEIVKAFKKAHPQYGRVYYETLPPGIIEEQVRKGSLVIGNLRITLQPDLFTGGKEKIKKLDAEGWFDETVSYAGNRLAIMVHKKNPKNIHTIDDLGRSDVNVSMPDPEIEDIAKKIIKLYSKAGDDKLRKKIMEEKTGAGTTFITQIHHRQTPVRIMEGLSDAGPVWYTEAYFQKTIGNPLDIVEIPLSETTVSTSAAGRMKSAPHKQAASDFLQFLRKDEAQAIFRKYGFSAPE